MPTTSIFDPKKALPPNLTPILSLGEEMERREHIVKRATDVLAVTGVVYTLGRGGRVPTAEWPWANPTELDCTGFSSWCCGIDRYQPRSKLYAKYNGGWVSTDAIVYDAKRPKEQTGFYTQIPFWEAAPGDLVVYGDYNVIVNKKPVHKQGHVAVITKLGYTLEKGASSKDYSRWMKTVVEITHCSSTNYKKFGSAIQTTYAGIFDRPDAIFARFDP